MHQSFHGNGYSKDIGEIYSLGRLKKKKMVCHMSYKCQCPESECNQEMLLATAKF